MAYKESLSTKTLYMYRRDKPPSGSFSTVATYSMNRIEGLQTKGANTPNFHARKKRGELLPFTNFVQLENKRLYDRVFLHHRQISDGYEIIHDGTGIADESKYYVNWSMAETAGSDKFDRNVIMQAAGAKQVSAGWDVLTFAAEVGQTVSMFKGLLTKVVNLIKTKPPGTPWNLWLEARYGWRTLAFDMQDIEQAFSKRKPSSIHRSSAGNSISWMTQSYITYPGLAWQTQHIYANTYYEVNVRGRVITKSEVPRFQINFLKTAWEVTRLSFVVDWFINVGRFIDALQFALTTDGYQAGYGTKVKITYAAWWEFTPNTTWTAVTTPVAQTAHEALITRREPADIPLIPLFSVNLDRFKVLDLVSLLIQAIRR